MATHAATNTKPTHKKALITTIVFALAAAIFLVLAGCSNQLKDQGDIQQASPDYAVTIMNADDYPNMTLVCFKGVGFMTTTRDLNAAVEVPEWNAFCASKQPAPVTSTTP